MEQTNAKTETDARTHGAPRLAGGLGLSLHLHCDTCGWEEDAPFEIGDECICGGTFDTPENLAIDALLALALTKR